MSSSLANTSLFIEAGRFNGGGWVLDTQFIPNMGSAYLLAHGLGKAVADACAEVVFPAAGTYHVWAFTRDWVAPWKTGAAPGLFQVKVNGEMVGRVFGDEGEAWHWQCGGDIHIAKRESTVSLCDLTGFEGRCAALFFTQDETCVPPNDIAELATFRRMLTGNADEQSWGAYDLAVAGGGIAGICTALSAARNGLKVALIQDRSVVGGNNSSEVRVWLGGATCFEPYPKIGSIVGELEQAVMAHYGKTNIGENYEDEKKLKLLEDEPNITLFMQHAVIGAHTEGSLIKAAQVLNVRTGTVGRINATLFADCTGDGTLGAAAGADFEVTTNGHMGMTNVWYVEDTGEAQSFPRCPWAIDLSKVGFPGREAVSSVYDQHGELALGGWYWESGCEHDPIDKAEYARDTNFRAMYGAWDCLKNVDDDYKNYRLGNAAYIGGKRESRRLLGDIVLTKSDVLKCHVYEDRCVPSTWNFDVHYPDRQFYSAFHEGDAFLTFDYHEKFQTPYFVPYRCLYSRNVGNLFMAGRNVSVSHDALGTVRVMRTGGMMGEVVGKAARVCIQHGVLPRAVYAQHLPAFIELLK